MLLFIALSLVPTPDEQLDRPTQSMNALGEAARASRQTRQIMSQFSVITFHRVGLRLVVHALMRAPPAQLAVGVKGVGEVTLRGRRTVDNSLHHLRRAFLADRVRDDAARLPLDESDDIGGLFLVPTKVNNSSISSVPAVCGAGSAAPAGNRVCAELTQLATDW